MKAEASFRPGFDSFVAPAVPAVLRSWWLVVTLSLVGGVCGLSVALLQSPEYESSSTLYVTSGAAGDSATVAYQGSLASQQRITSYVDLARSDAVIAEAVKESRVPMSVAEAQAAIRAEAKPDTVLLTVSATSHDPQTAYRLARAVSESLSSYVAKLEVPAGGGVPLARLTIVSPSSLSASPVSPRPLLFCLVGLGCGAIVGLLIAVVRLRLDVRIRNESDVESEVSAPVIGIIPESADIAAQGSLNFGLSGLSAIESYRKLRTNLEFVGVDSAVRVVVVTSAAQGDGKSTTAINMAASLAEAGSRVVLIDCDLRRPSVADRLALTGSVGVSNSFRDGLSWVDLAQASAVVGLDVIASGPPVPNPPELLAASSVSDLMVSLRSNYDYVIIDTPPCLAVTDAAVVSRFADGVVLVVRADRTTKMDLRAATRSLELANSSVIGVVINSFVASESSVYYRAYAGQTSAQASLGDSAESGGRSDGL